MNKIKPTSYISKHGQRNGNYMNSIMIDMTFVNIYKTCFFPVPTKMKKKKVGYLRLVKPLPPLASLLLSATLQLRPSFRMMSKKLTFALVLAATAAIAYGYGSGAPVEACGDMIPQHHVAPQSTPLPYRVSVSKNSIKSGEKVLITISGGEFKGFFVQGRVGEVPVGSFEPAPGVKLVDCNGRGSGATHSDSNSKQQIALTWVAPQGLSETVRFRVTVAQDGGTFWVGHQSSPLTISA